MSAPKENPSIPSAGKLGGTRGADAGNVSRRAAEHTPLGWLAGTWLQAAILSASAVALRYAADTDTPDPRIVEVADLLDSALWLAEDATPRLWGSEP